ncbi:MAG TPA: hypothetical protein PLI70_07565 [Gemmatimonadales bacterium]|nr:hypothetical protein [Gemmatimonadales bacterium]HRZ09433.1 hypothetical protein [Gemmatimonadales bacterium]
MSPTDPLLAAVSGIANACCPLPGLVTGGQPNDAQFRAARAAGAVTVLDIRDPMEPRPFDEPALAASLGLRYVNISVTGHSLDDTTLEKILAVLRDDTAAPVFFHCGSGNRVGGALIPYFMLDKGMEEDDAVALAMRIGLRGADLLQWGLEYAHRHAR